MPRKLPSNRPYSFYLRSNFGRLAIAMDLKSLIADGQAEPKVLLSENLAIVL